MALAFNADEILQMAEQIERNGSRFYRAAARQFSAQQKVLITLADQEDGHLRTFSGLRKQLTKAEKAETAYDPNNETAQYLKAMADRRVFDVGKPPDDRLGSQATFTEILGVALGMEKESIAFYAGLLELVSPALGRDKVETIIREEYRHIAFLVALFDNQCPASAAAGKTGP